MICPKRAVPLSSLLLISIAVEHPTGAAPKDLTLTADVGKTVFFEGEPIFLLLRLTNVGSDTAWVIDDFAAISHAVQMSLRRDGEAVPVGGLWIDYMCPLNGDRCGKPLAPGKSRLTAGILQDRAGDERDRKRSLFMHHLPPGEYELRVSTHGVDAAPIAFRVRERSATETRDLNELEAVRSMMSDQIPYEGAQMSWAARHPPDDPFFPFVLAQWLYIPGTMQGIDLDSLRSVVLHADRSSPAGAYLAQSMEGRRPEQLGALLESLGTSLAGEMARYLVERRQRKQR